LVITGNGNCFVSCSMFLYSTTSAGSV
jgi:hypothetical protein